MRKPIESVNWIDQNEMMDELLQQQDTLTMHQMDQGFEAEVMKIQSGAESFVLKIWNKHSKPNVRFQFHLLNALSELGLSVSKAIGWGTNAEADCVLLTTFDGTPVTKVNEQNMTEFANMLSNIHQTHVHFAENIQIPSYDFIDYFFHQAKEHPDIYQALLPLVSRAQMKQNRFIHGDFHLANIVEANERYTVIDWTNGQLGDPRYDFAWALILMKIYLSDQYANVFRAAYVLENEITQDDLEVFEALACLRWILLNRNDGTPKGPRTIAKVEKIIKKNRSLKKLSLVIS